MTIRTPNPVSTHPWTNAQDEELRRLVRSNTPLADIARTLSRTPETVASRIHELNARRMH
ncbi:MAG: hypothetical protein R3C52_06210 [Hyphomonadaceae bacterium]